MDRLKACLVAKGYTQIYDFDYDITTLENLRFFE